MRVWVIFGKTFFYNRSIKVQKPFIGFSNHALYPLHSPGPLWALLETTERLSDSDTWCLTFLPFVSFDLNLDETQSLQCSQKFWGCLRWSWNDCQQMIFSYVAQHRKHLNLQTLLMVSTNIPSGSCVATHSAFCNVITSVSSLFGKET